MPLLFSQPRLLLESPVVATAVQVVVSGRYFWATALGCLSHALFWIHGNHLGRPSALRTVVVYMGNIAVFTLLNVLAFGLSAGLTYSAFLSLWYFVGLFSSIIVYRLFFHRIRHFPGPFVGKFTKLHGIWINRHHRMHEWFLDMQEKYGDFVRIGPNELMVLHIDAVEVIHGGRSRCTKGPVYEAVTLNGEGSVATMLDPYQHRWRRQLWDKGLSTKNLHVYEQGMLNTINEFLRKMDELEGTPVNTTLYSLLIPFTNMGYAGFTRSWNLLQAGKENRLLDIIEVIVSNASIFGHSLSWPLQLLAPLNEIFNFDPRQREFIQLLDDCIRDRINRPDAAELTDLMSHLLADYTSEKPRALRNVDMMRMDTAAVIIAASDTMAVTLAMAFYHLAKFPEMRAKLRDELRPLARAQSSVFSTADLAEAGYLNGIINEALRMFPPVSAGGSRITPEDGVYIGDTFIPPGVEVFLAHWNYHRSERFWKEPNTFMPERWTPVRADAIIDSRAFHPFNIGTYNCVGRRFALMFMRMVLSYTIWNFDFQFAPGEDGTAMMEKIRNEIVLKAGPCFVTFKRLPSSNGDEA